MTQLKNALQPYLNVQIKMKNCFFAYLFLLIFILFSNTICNAQKGIQWRVFGGSNATIVIENFYDRVAFFASPPRPYYSINYFGGVEAIKPMNDWLDISLGLNYEKISSSPLGFAKRKDPIHNYDFLAFTLSGKIQPIKKRNISLIFGLNQYFNINFAFARRVQREWPLAAMMGFEFRINNSFHVSFRTLQALSHIRKGYEIINNEAQLFLKTNFHSFQIAFAFDIKLKK